MHRATRLVLKGIHRTVGRWLPPTLLAVRYPGIPGRVHVDDLMLRSERPEHLRHYLEDGTEGAVLLDDALARAGRTFDGVGSCLIFPAGYGRVLRHVCARLDPKRITAADIDANAVRFCVREFGVCGLVSRRDFRSIRFPTTYDLIFVGSLLTHLPHDRYRDLLDVLTSALAPLGLIVFSTQGESCLDHLSWYGKAFADAEADFRSQVATRGIGFVPYPGHEAYGITVVADSYVTATISQVNSAAKLRFVAKQDRGWDRHQDVWTYQWVAGDPN